MSIGKMFQLAFVINGTMSAGFSNAFSKSSQAMSHLSDTMKFVKNEQKRLNTAFDTGQLSASAYARTMRSLQKEFDQTKAKQESLSAAMSARKEASNRFSAAKSSLFSAASTAAVFSAPFIGIMDTAMDFEASMSKVKAITGATGEDFEKLTATAKVLGAKTQFSASQSAEAMTYLGMAGWKTQEIIAGMPGLLDLAAASGEDLATTADIVSDDLTAFRMSADQAGHMADVMAAASSNANTNVRLMGETFKYCAPVAGSLGYSLEDTSIAVGLMANAGIKGSDAGTALRATMTRLVKPPKEAAEALGELGVSATNSDGTMKPLRTTIAELRQKFAGLSDAEKAQKAASIAGQEAMSGFLAIINASEKDLNKLTEAIDHSEGKAAEMAKVMQENAKGAMTRLKSAAESVSLSIGGVFLPALAGVADKMAVWAGGLAEIAGKYPNAVKWTLAAGGALAGLFIYYKVTKLASEAYNIVKTATILFYQREAAMAGAAKAATKGYSGALRIITGMQWAWNAAMAANPVGVVMAGIMVLIGVGYLLYKNWDKVKAFFTTIWESPAAKFALFLTGPVGWLIAGTARIIANWDKVKAWFVTLWENPDEALNQFIDMLKGQFSGIRYWLGGIWDGIANGAAAAWDSITSGIGAAWDSFIQFISALPSLFVRGLGYVLGYLSTMPKKIGIFIDAAGDWLSKLPERCMTAGAEFVTAAGIWLSQAYDTTTTWIRDTVSSVYSWLLNLPQNCEEAGAAFIAAAESWASGAYDAVCKWIKQIPNMISNSISEAGAGISNWWAGIKQNFSVGFSAGAADGKPKYQNAKGGIYGKGAFVTSFAEESPEAAIPINGSPRAIGLWERTGELLGVKPRDGVVSGGSIAATFAPQIHIAGNADAATVQQMQQIMKESLADFERKLAALKNQKARVSYA